MPEFTVLEKPQIQRFLPEPSEIIATLETGYISYENGQSIIPEVGYLPLEQGEVHIKYGRIQGEEIAVVKIASGYYGPKLANQSSSSSCNLVLNSTTGQPVGILNDEGLLTDIRTAIATIVASKRIYKKGDIYGVVGGGGQAYYGVKPDISVFGKIIGHGYPSAAAIGGRSDVIRNVLFA